MRFKGNKGLPAHVRIPSLYPIGRGILFFLLCAASGGTAASAVSSGKLNNFGILEQPDSLHWEILTSCCPWLNRDSTCTYSQLSRCRDSLFAHGYLEAAFDSLQPDSTNLYYCLSAFHLGRQYRVTSLPDSLAPFGQDSTPYYFRYLTPSTLLRLAQRIAQDSSLDLPASTILSVVAKNLDPSIYTLHTAVYSQRYHKLCQVDIAGVLPRERRWLATKLGLHLGDSLTDSQLQRVGVFAQEIPYLSLAAPVGFDYTTQGVTLHLAFSRRRASNLDGILGFSPASTEDQWGKWYGNIHTKLLNVCRLGESLEATWRSDAKGGTQANLSIDYPFILASSWGASLSADWIRLDSLNQRAALHLTASYALSARTTLSCGYEWAETQGENPDDTAKIHTHNPIIKSSSAYNPSIISRTVGIRLGYDYRRVNYSTPWNDGYFLQTIVSLSRRRVGDGAPHSTLRLAVDWGQSHPFGLRGLAFRIAGSIRSYALLAKGVQPLLAEVYRLGGTRSPRGYPEAALIAQHYATLNLEPEWRLASWVAIGLLADYAALLPARTWGQKQHNPSNYLGVGGGVRIKLPLGEFRFWLAKGYNLPRFTATRGVLLHLQAGFSF